MGGSGSPVGGAEEPCGVAVATSFLVAPSRLHEVKKARQSMAAVTVAATRGRPVAFVPLEKKKCIIGKTPLEKRWSFYTMNPPEARATSAVHVSSPPRTPSRRRT